MKNIAKFSIFILYTICIFFIKDKIAIGGLCFINILVGILLKINFKKMVNQFLIFLPFIIITAVINIIFSNLYFGLLIGLRLIICYHATYLFSKMFTVMDFAETIERLFFPLKIFKVNTRNIGIMLSISLCIIPVFHNEMQDTLKAMKSKGQKIKISQINLLIKPIFISLLRKTSEMEKTLISKGYVE